MPNHENEMSLPRMVACPETALCLRVPGCRGEELVVHREGEEDYVFLFEALDDACDYAGAAQKALGFTPEIGRVNVDELHFRTARFKPAIGDQIDMAIHAPRRR